MYLMIDNEDSFVYNLASCFRDLECEMEVVKKIERPKLSYMIEHGLEGLVISSGPGGPRNHPKCTEALDEAEGRIPVLGISLGHHIIGYYYDAKITRGARPMDGKVTRMNNYGTGILYGLPKSFYVTRYHTQVVSDRDLPDCLRVDARSSDGEIMAISHREVPVFGLQFHPEALMTEYGHEIIANFMDVCEAYR